ncbi:uncharacterized protein FOMMEDRAFT_60799, partial [Fomitiporia mediterranea MF3/22]|uniref:uncharacterized protein n=1 Tax=Fomitiporia mediterranea (strain MF3/22) TaxID=694068 RepID=UPI0004407323
IEFRNHWRDARPSYEEFINILRCAPNLTSLELDYSGPDLRQQGSATQPIFLPNLRYLALGFVEEEEACSLLRLFYAPALKSISLDLGGDIY